MEECIFDYIALHIDNVDSTKTHSFGVAFKHFCRLTSCDWLLKKKGMFEPFPNQISGSFGIKTSLFFFHP